MLTVEHISPGQKLADSLARVMGSWPFIIIQSLILVCWITANIVAAVHRWDPYPFILLNLALSFQAAYAAPVIMMSQNRQAAKDRQMALDDYIINMKAEKEIAFIIGQLKKQDVIMLDMSKRIKNIEKRINPSFTLD